MKQVSLSGNVATLLMQFFGYVLVKYYSIRYKKCPQVSGWPHIVERDEALKLFGKRGKQGNWNLNFGHFWQSLWKSILQRPKNYKKNVQYCALCIELQKDYLK